MLLNQKVFCWRLARPAYECTNNGGIYQAAAGIEGGDEHYWRGFARPMARRSNMHGMLSSIATIKTIGAEIIILPVRLPWLCGRYWRGCYWRSAMEVAASSVSIERKTVLHEIVNASQHIGQGVGLIAAAAPSLSA